MDRIPRMRIIRLLAFATIVALASSCVGIDAEARIAANGSISLNIVYTVSTAVDEIGKIGANSSYLPLPVGKGDLELAAARSGGTLQSWSRTDQPDRFIIKAVLAFPGAASFVAFMDPSGTLSSFTTSGGRRMLTMTLGGGSPPADAELSAFIKAAFEDYSVSLRFQLPSAPLTSTGLQVSGRTASFSMLSSDLYTSQDPVAISVTW